MKDSIKKLQHLRGELEKAPPFRKAEAAGCLFDALLNYLMICADERQGLADRLSRVIDRAEALARRVDGLSKKS